MGCKELNHPSNGRVQFPIPIKYQSVAVYTCSAGYDLKGTSSRECLGDGVWSGTEPTCILGTILFAKSHPHYIPIDIVLAYHCV